MRDHEEAPVERLQSAAPTSPNLDVRQRHPRAEPPQAGGASRMSPENPPPVISIGGG